MDMSSSSQQEFYIQNQQDGRRFKMVIAGQLRKLSVSKIRRYLINAGLAADGVLSHHGQILEEGMIGEHFGLVAGAVLTLSTSSPSCAPQSSPLSSSSSHPTAPLRLPSPPFLHSEDKMDVQASSNDIITTRNISADSSASRVHNHSREEERHGKKKDVDVERNRDGGDSTRGKGVVAAAVAGRDGAGGGNGGNGQSFLSASSSSGLPPPPPKNEVNKKKNVRQKEMNEREKESGAARKGDRQQQPQQQTPPPPPKGAELEKEEKVGHHNNHDPRALPPLLPSPLPLPPHCLNIIAIANRNLTVLADTLQLPLTWSNHNNNTSPVGMAPLPQSPPLSTVHQEKKGQTIWEDEERKKLFSHQHHQTSFSLHRDPSLLHTPLPFHPLGIPAVLPDRRDEGGEEEEEEKKVGVEEEKRWKNNAINSSTSPPSLPSSCTLLPSFTTSFSFHQFCVFPICYTENKRLTATTVIIMRKTEEGVEKREDNEKQKKEEEEVELGVEEGHGKHKAPRPPPRFPSSPTLSSSSSSSVPWLYLHLDLPAERIIISAVVAPVLPIHDEAILLYVYRLLLQGSLFGKNTCGGSLGIVFDDPPLSPDSRQQQEKQRFPNTTSTTAEGEGHHGPRSPPLPRKNGKVILQTSIFLKYSEDRALVEIIPHFIETLQKWRALLQEVYDF